MEKGIRTHISIKDLERTIREIKAEDDLRFYRDLGNGLYELPGNIITNNIGLEKYLKQLEK